jgi:linoleate 10R-lipoxygenase
VYLNFDPANDWKLRESSTDTFKTVVKYVSAHLDHISGVSSPFYTCTMYPWLVEQISISDVFFHTAMVNDQSHEFLKKLNASGKGLPHTELAASLFAEVIPTAAHYSQTLSHVVNFYLGSERKEAREDIVRLASLHTEAADARIVSYAHEALRMAFECYSNAAFANQSLQALILPYIPFPIWKISQQ